MSIGRLTSQAVAGDQAGETNGNANTTNADNATYRGIPDHIGDSSMTRSHSPTFRFLRRRFLSARADQFRKPSLMVFFLACPKPAALRTEPRVTAAREEHVAATSARLEMRLLVSHGETLSQMDGVNCGSERFTSTMVTLHTGRRVGDRSQIGQRVRFDLERFRSRFAGAERCPLPQFVDSEQNAHPLIRFGGVAYHHFQNPVSRHERNLGGCEVEMVGLYHGFSAFQNGVRNHFGHNSNRRQKPNGILKRVDQIRKAHDGQSIRAASLVRGDH